MRDYSTMLAEGARVVGEFTSRTQANANLAAELRQQARDRDDARGRVLAALCELPSALAWSELWGACHTLQLSGDDPLLALAQARTAQWPAFLCHVLEADITGASGAHLALVRSLACDARRPWSASATLRNLEILRVTKNGYPQDLQWLLNDGQTPASVRELVLDVAQDPDGDLGYLAGFANNPLDAFTLCSTSFIEWKTSTIRAVADSEHLRSLSRFALTDVMLSDEQIEVISSATFAASITTLDLRRTELNVEALVAAAGAWLAITMLDVSENPLHAYGSLLKSPLASQLDALGIGFGELEEDAVSDAIAQLSELHSRVIALTFGNFCAITGAHIGSILGARWFPHVRHLGFRDCEMAGDCAARLAQSPRIAGLETLTVAGCGLGDAGVAAILKSAHTHRLQDLELSDNDTTEELAALLPATLFLPIPGLELGWTHRELGTRLTSTAAAPYPNDNPASRIRLVRASGHREWVTPTPELRRAFGAADAFLTYHCGSWSGFVDLGDGRYGFACAHGEDSDPTLSSVITGHPARQRPEWINDVALVWAEQDADAQSVRLYLASRDGSARGVAELQLAAPLRSALPLPGTGRIGLVDDTGRLAILVEDGDTFTVQATVDLQTARAQLRAFAVADNVTVDAVVVCSPEHVEVLAVSATEVRRLARFPDFVAGIGAAYRNELVIPDAQRVVRAEQFGGLDRELCYALPGIAHTIATDLGESPDAFEQLPDAAEPLVQDLLVTADLAPSDAAWPKPPAAPTSLSRANSLGPLTCDLVSAIRAAPPREPVDEDLLSLVRHADLPDDLRALVDAWAHHDCGHTISCGDWNLEDIRRTTAPTFAQGARLALQVGIRATGPPVIARVLRRSEAHCEMVDYDDEVHPYRYPGIESYLAFQRER